MSDEERPKGFLVGYGKPPAEHQFRKGQSGNPAGRPRRKRVPRDESFDIGMAPTRRLILDEAYRPITIREGERTVTLPTIQAVVRSMSMQALKGNRVAQKNLADLVQKIEGQDFTSRQELFKSAVEYKDRWEAEFKRCDRLGIPRPEPVPHPDDIEIDVNTAGVRFRGPKTEHEKALFERGMDHVRDLIEENAYLQKCFKRKPLPDHVQKIVRQNQKQIDRINTILTPRYKKRLLSDAKD